MADKRIKRKIVWDQKGVSEIIGTILMLSITVVLFSSIIAYVGQMPAPRESFHVELECSLVPLNESDWAGGVAFIIKHQGGQPMDDLFIRMFLAIDGTTLSRKVSDGLIDSKVLDGKWGLGETWRNVVSVVDTGVPFDSDSTYSITIINTEKNVLVWQETIGEEENAYSPVIKKAWIDSDLGTIVDDPGPISFTDDFKIFVHITDPEGNDPNYGLNQSDIWVNLSAIGLGILQLQDVWDVTDTPGDDVYVTVSGPPDRNLVPIGYHYFVFSASDYDDQKAKNLTQLFPVGMIVGENPQIVVRGNKLDSEGNLTNEYEGIYFSNVEPVNGDTITIYATIMNHGGGSAEVNVSFYDGVESNDTLIGTDYMLLHAQGERDARVSWLAAPGGVHDIIVNASLDPVFAAEKGVYDPYIWDNVNHTFLSVMPKILLVDDDGAVNDKSDTDTASFMRASLEAADFEYDYISVGAGDGPGYDYGDYPLQDYDVVIWMCGYQYTGTLTHEGADNDVANLEKYLDGASSGGNGGSLWFISQGFWLELWPIAALSTFADDYMHVPPLLQDNATIPPLLFGNDTHPVTDYPTDYFAKNPIDCFTRPATAGDPDMERVWYWPPSGPVDPDRIALYENSTDRCYGITYDSDDYAVDTTTDSRLFIQPWEFSRIENTATQAQYTYKVIMWLGNITMKYTSDVAISEQTVEPESVFYKQSVTIKFVVRNNGFDVYNSSDADSQPLWFLLRITDIYGNDVLTPYLAQIDYLGSGNNNTITISHPWTPERIGYHRVEIKVDPYNYIEESNELNNEISDFLTTGEMNVQYRILVVDDDNSVNNGNLLNPANETAEVTNALIYLNAAGTYQYEFFVVNGTADGPPPNATGDAIGLGNYNAVIWVTGEEVSPLTLNDKLNITEYLKYGGNVWLLGDGLWSTLGDFEQDYIKIGDVNENVGTPTNLLGVEDDPISHGMDFSGSGGANGDRLTPTVDGSGFFYENASINTFNSIRYSGELPPSVGSNVTYRSVTTAWLFSSLDSNLTKAEIVFMVLRWFDKPEDRVEARITDMDLWLSDAHPQFGNGYVLQATVHNTGGSVANVLVRFIDGNTQIGSDSISISGNEVTTAEMIWVPLFAGQRTISVLVDPIEEVDEIFEWHNNNATLDTYVYFFWDDMESGAGRWAHSSTILLINGEEALEYFYDTELDTDILTEWDQARSVGVQITTRDYHSFDSCFWLQEPPGGAAGSRIPVDIVFALDTSGSMAAEIGDLKAATKDFIGQLTDNDRCAIWTFDGGGDENCGPYLDINLQYAFMTQANKDSFNISIDSFTAIGHTPFYDTLGAAMQYSQTGLLPGRLEFVIGMTDGASNSDDVYTPNANWGQTVAGDTQYSTVAPHPTEGMLYPPMMVHTVGLGITHDGSYPTAPSWSRTSPDPAAFPLEYDIWHVADSSPDPLHDAGGKYGENETTGEDNVGHYYYTTDSTQLTDIFQDIFKTISQVQLVGENQTKSAPPIEPQLTVSLFSETFVANDGNWLGDDNGETAPSQEWWFVAQAVTDTGDISVGDYDNVPDGRCLQIIDADAGWGGQYAEGRYNGNNWFDLTGYAGSWYGQLNWSVRSVGCEADDQWRVEVTRNGGGAWTTVVGPYNGNTPGTWTQYSYPLQAADFASNQWGFRLNTVSGHSSDHHSFDDITLEVIYDPTSPTIISTLPIDGATSVAPNAQVVITFSEPMDTSTVTYTCTPDPGGWTESWENGDTLLRLTHATDFDLDSLYTFEITAGQDMAGNPLNNTGAPNPWTFTTEPDTFAPYIMITDPFDGETIVPLDAPIVITFNESMNTTTFNYSCLPNPGGWGVSWNPGNTTATLTHFAFQASQPHLFNVTYAEDAVGNLIVPGPVPNPWNFVTWTDTTPPTITLSVPYEAQVNVAINQPIYIRFSEEIDIPTLLFTCTPNPGGWLRTWDDGNTLLTLLHYDFDMLTMYHFEVTRAWDLATNDLAPGAVPNPFMFTTGEEAIPMANFNKTAVTETMNLENLDSAKLSFWHKYNLMPGANGGFLQVGTNDSSGTWKWRYIIPANAYTGNLRASVWVNDSYGQRVYWCWNGVSGRGTFDWDFVTVDLLNFVPASYRNEVKVKFNYTQYGGGTGYGWYIDDVRVEVSRSDLQSPDALSQDIWDLTSAQAHSGNFSWSNVDPDTGLMKPGIDNYLKTMPIDLTNARNAYLSAYVKFNLNEDSGAPPDGFRVEVSRNNGVTWVPINLGVRTGWGVSGTGLDNEDGNISDGKTYTGLPDSGEGNAALDDYWVSIGTLTRINIDLSSFSGNAIQIRFRIATCNHPLYKHDNIDHAPDPGFGGFYVDDVIVYGETIITG